MQASTTYMLFTKYRYILIERTIATCQYLRKTGKAGKDHGLVEI
jgi:hypothetical protein